MMLDHIALNVRDVAAAKAFYLKALAPLGYEVFREFGHNVGLQSGGFPDFWLSQRDEPSAPVHVAFRTDRAAVDAFHAAAVAAGGRRQRSPGDAPRLPRTLLRGVRARSRREQHRGRLSRAGIGPRGRPDEIRPPEPFNPT